MEESGSDPQESVGIRRGPGRPASASSAYDLSEVIPRPWGTIISILYISSTLTSGGRMTELPDGLLRASPRPEKKGKDRWSEMKEVRVIHRKVSAKSHQRALSARWRGDGHRPSDRSRKKEVGSPTHARHLQLTRCELGPTRHSWPHIDEERRWMATMCMFASTFMKDGSINRSRQSPRSAETQCAKNVQGEATGLPAPRDTRVVGVTIESILQARGLSFPEAIIREGCCVGLLCAP